MKPRYRLACVAILTFTFFRADLAPAQTPDLRCPLTTSQATLYSPAIDAQLACLAFPDAPCANRDNIIWDAAAMVLKGHPAEATGLDVASWTTTSCDITADPEQWRVASPYTRCFWRVHEVGHLAGRHHVNNGGLMDGTIIGEYAPCRAAHAPAPMAAPKHRKKKAKHRRQLRRSSAARSFDSR